MGRNSVKMRRGREERLQSNETLVTDFFIWNVGEEHRMWAQVTWALGLAVPFIRCVIQTVM